MLEQIFQKHNFNQSFNLTEVFTLNVIEIKHFPYIFMLYIIIYLHGNNNDDYYNNNNNNTRMVKALPNALG